MKYIKHPPFKDGSREHVESWYGYIGKDGKMHSRTVCSEPNCELNKKEVKQ